MMVKSFKLFTESLGFEVMPKLTDAGKRLIYFYNSEMDVGEHSWRGSLRFHEGESIESAIKALDSVSKHFKEEGREVLIKAVKELLSDSEGLEPRTEDHFLSMVDRIAEYLEDWSSFNDRNKNRLSNKYLRNIKQEMLDILSLLHKPITNEKSHMKKYKEFIVEMNDDIQFKLDDILDKISSQGKNSLTDMEQEFLDSFNKNKEEEVHHKQLRETGREFYDRGAFKFKIDEWEEYEEESNEHHIIYGNLIVSVDRQIEFYGKIVLNDAGQVEYYMFSPANDPLKEVPGNPGVYEEPDVDHFDEILDEWKLEVEFYEFVEYIVTNEM